MKPYASSPACFALQILAQASRAGTKALREGEMRFQQLETHLQLIGRLRTGCSNIRECPRLPCLSNARSHNRSGLRVESRSIWIPPLACLLR